MHDFIGRLRSLFGALAGDVEHAADSTVGRLDAILREVEGALAHDGADIGQRVTRIVRALEGILGRTLEPSHIAHLTGLVEVLENLWANREAIGQTAAVDAVAARRLLTDIRNLDFENVPTELRVILTSLQSLLNHIAPVSGGNNA